MADAPAQHVQMCPYVLTRGVLSQDVGPFKVPKRKRRALLRFGLGGVHQLSSNLCTDVLCINAH